MNSTSKEDISVKNAAIRDEFEKAPVFALCQAWNVGIESVWWIVVLFECWSKGLKCCNTNLAARHSPSQGNHLCCQPDTRAEKNPPWSLSTVPSSRFLWTSRRPPTAPLAWDQSENVCKTSFGLGVWTEWIFWRDSLALSKTFNKWSVHVTCSLDPLPAATFSSGDNSTA